MGKNISTNKARCAMVYANVDPTLLHQLGLCKLTVYSNWVSYQYSETHLQKLKRRKLEKLCFNAQKFWEQYLPHLRNQSLMFTFFRMGMNVRRLNIHGCSSKWKQSCLYDNLMSCGLHLMMLTENKLDDPRMFSVLMNTYERTVSPGQTVAEEV